MLVNESQLESLKVCDTVCTDGICKLLNLYGCKRCLDHRHLSLHKWHRERNSAEGLVSPRNQ